MDDVELVILAGRWEPLLVAAADAPSIAARRHARDALARALLVADPGALDPPLEAQLRALGVDASAIDAARAPRQPHAVDVPLALSARDGERTAFVRQVLVTYDPIGSSSHDALSDVARYACANAIAQAGRDHGAPHEASAHRLIAAQPAAFVRARIDGPSLSAAAYVSASALFTGRAVRAGRVITGAVAGRAVVSVGHIEAKVDAALAHRASALIVPEADAARARDHVGARSLEIVGVSTLDALSEEATEATASARSSERMMEEARTGFERAWNGFRWASVRDSLARTYATLPGARVDLRVETLTRLGASLRHLGDPMGSLDWMDAALELARSPDGLRGVPDAPLSYLWLQRAMTLRQLGRFAEGERAARRADAVAKRARLSRERIKALGTVGILALSRHKVGAAIAAFEESLEVGLAFEPHRVARSRAYLIDAYARAQRADDVEVQLAEAEAELDRERAAGSERAWVRSAYAGARLALGDPAAALAALEIDEVRDAIAHDPLPGLFARRSYGLALCRLGEARRGYEVLAASPFVYGRALEPHLSFVAHLNVLHEAIERLRLDAWDADIAGRASLALAHVPRHGELPRLLRAAIARAERSLLRHPSEKALDAVLERCARLT
ncbi:MAG: hypothetical protein AB7S26_36180 [Sandaracinaceae bacterium]